MNKIKEKREALGLSQAALGEKIGCSQQHIQRLENGYEITPDKIIALSNVLDIPMQDLISNNLKKILLTLNGEDKKMYTTNNYQIQSFDEQKFKDVISTAYRVFAEYPNKGKSIEILANKLADICYDAIQIDTSDRYAQIKTLVNSWYNNDNKIAG